MALIIHLVMACYCYSETCFVVRSLFFPNDNAPPSILSLTLRTRTFESLGCGDSNPMRRPIMV